MKCNPLRAAVALTAALTTAASPLLAEARTSYELKKYVPTLVVNGPGTGQAPGSGGTPPDSQPGLQLSTSAINFGDVATNTTETRQVLVSNTGTGSLSFTAVPAVTGAAEFAAGLTSCGTTLAAGADCLTDATFSPTAVGTFNGVLTFTSILVSSPHEVTLVGTAFNPVSLASMTLPKAMVGKAYSYDFKQLLTVSNETSPDKGQAKWEGSGTLPAGLRLDKETGVLAGTPSEVTPGASYTVTGTYKNNQGQHVYTITVRGEALEVVQIALGATHTCVITLAGGVKCWGDGADGKLGNGSTTSSLTPIDVLGLTSGVKQISAGTYQTCAVTNAGGAKCWGGNKSGQLGDGTTIQRLTPIDVEGLTSGVVSISTNAYGGNSNAHTCAVTIGGAAKCWGSNSSGRLGDGTSTSRRTPTDVVGLSSGVTVISAGGAQTCAVHQGAAKCWGAGGNGRLGNGSTSIQYLPVSVSGMNSGVVEISTGGGHSCARTSAGAVWCWGQNSSGELGDGTQADRSTPVAVSGLGHGIASIQVGYSYTCALSVSGGVQCWGLNSAGRLGDGTTTKRLTPVSVEGLTTGVRSIMVNAANDGAAAHTCAMLVDGTARCWGNNAYGQLGDGTTIQRLTPVEVLP